MTIRYIALLAFCITIAVFSLPEVKKVALTQTGRDLDIAIVGRGNLGVVNDDFDGVHYTRNGSLSLNQDSQLCVMGEGASWVVEPVIHVPSGWERIALLPDGRVQSYSSGVWITVGQLQLAVFPATLTFDDVLAMNAQPDGVGVPTLHIPGEGAGLIQQGWVEQSAFESSDLLVRVLLATLVANMLWQLVSKNHAVRNPVE